MENRDAASFDDILAPLFAIPDPAERAAKAARIQQALNKIVAMVDYRAQLRIQGVPEHRMRAEVDAWLATQQF